MNRFLFLALRIIVAVILIQTLRFKFLAHPDSVFIFTQAGLEPAGRIIIGLLELIAAFLIIFPKTVWLGAGLTLGIISGAIFLHLTKIGIEVQGDGGSLFYTAILIFVLSSIILWNERKKIPVVGNNI
ncbi:MAG: DoxX family protein [Bacteroidetes bacterium]|nr:MAG: DoxX family protein [Bacteroidota bacterium]